MYLGVNAKYAITYILTRNRSKMGKMGISLFFSFMIWQVPSISLSDHGEEERMLFSISEPSLCDFSWNWPYVKKYINFLDSWLVFHMHV